jgi:peptidoglycan hydrolase FlgJ
MDPNGLGSKLGNVAGGLAADSRSLDQLKRAARDDPRQAVKKVATQFEALFMQMVLKSMREATPHSGLLDSQEQDVYRGMLDQQVAQQVAAKGTGLSELIARQLGRNLPGATATATGASAANASQALTPGPSPTGVGEGSISFPFQRAGDGSSSSPLPRAGEGLGVRVPSGASKPPLEAQRAFMQAHWSDAVRAQQLTGVPASFILGQAALESGWGQREIRAADGSPSYNLFGIKAGPGWQGKTTQVTTTEYDGGVPHNTVQSFRAYDGYAAAFQDWALTIGRNQRYSAAVASTGNASGFALGMQQAGYSTDPTYAQKLAGVIRTASSIQGTG